MTEAILPTLTREDPRYYTLGHGGFFRRSPPASQKTPKVIPDDTQAVVLAGTPSF
jgi:hypothetical protein